MPNCINGVCHDPGDGNYWRGRDYDFRGGIYFPAAAGQGLGGNDFSYCSSPNTLPVPDPTTCSIAPYTPSQSDYTIIQVSCVSDQVDG